MWSKPVRYQNQHCLHFITFSCYRRMQLLGSAHARDVFERELERVRKWYGICVVGYVAMPEHVHLLIGEPERNELSIAIQMLKQITSRKLRPKNLPQFWQVRYYGFPVWTEKKRIEKLRYIHRNPVRRGLVRNLRAGGGAASFITRPERKRLLKSSRNGQHVSGRKWASRQLWQLPTLRQNQAKGWGNLASSNSSFSACVGLKPALPKTRPTWL